MEYLTLTNSTEIIRIASEDIVFIKGDGNYSDIYLSNDKKENVTCQLHELMDKLAKISNNPFCRVGKSLIVNKNFIFKVNPGLKKLLLSSCKMEKDILIQASKDALKELKDNLEKEGGNS